MKKRFLAIVTDLGDVMIIAVCAYAALIEVGSYMAGNSLIP